MERNNIQNNDKEYIANTYNRFDVVIEEGNGCILKDFNNNEFIDCASGIGVNVFGVNDLQWKTAVIEQLNKVQHVCNLYYAEPQVQLAKALCDLTGAKKVFFGNSGAEANECAIKTARKYGNIKYGDRYEIITLKNSFHGRTIATLSATGQDNFHKYFGPFVEGFRYADTSIESICECYTEHTVAVMMELIQGESGVNVLDKKFVKQVEQFCKERDILLIIDEVQTGNGRTGYMYSYEYFDIHPDIVTTAKGIGGGLPLGACLMFDKTEKVLSYGDHGTTFGGNPVACAGALSIVNRLNKDLFLEVQGKGAYLMAQLSRIKNVKSVSGLGLMIGIETTKSAREVAEKCMEKGLIVLTAHSKVRLLPPLTITKMEMDRALKILDEVIGS